MSQEPKKRHSRARQGKRRNYIHLAVKKSVACENCGQQHIPHTVCEHCGFYKGQQFTTPKTKSANN
jgi:large subunit ribosomal protein L32